MTGTKRNPTRKAPERGTKPARDSETASYEQLQGSPDVHGAPGKVRYPKQPHERDESAGAGERLDDDMRPPSDRQISQAANDVESGRVDTDRRGTPSDIPTSKSK